MKPEDFEMRETLDREALDRHPAWAPFRPGDREAVLVWGVPEARLEAELGRYEYCGPEPLFPLLGAERLPDRPDLIVAARIELADGRSLPGYRLAPLVVGVFAAGREWVFNQGLPSRARRVATEMARALDVSPTAILPLRFRTRVPDAAGTLEEGCFALEA